MMDRQLTFQIINAAIEVHQELGPGLLESIYRKCMKIELEDRGFQVQTEIVQPVIYKGRTVDDYGYRLDILVANEVVVELKSVHNVEPVHKKQLLTYLRLSTKELGLLINFNVALLKDGIYRIANNLKLV
jgi:GxxExxY protein